MDINNFTVVIFYFVFFVCYRNVVNDSFRTDVCLLYPPHQIALACLHIACVINQKDSNKQWFAELHTDLDKVLEVTKYIMNLYEMWKQFEKQEKKEIPELYVID